MSLVLVSLMSFASFVLGTIPVPIPFRVSPARRTIAKICFRVTTLITIMSINRFVIVTLTVT